MKFTVIALASLLSLALAQVQAPGGSFNVTNPIQGGTFVQGQTLPIVYDLLVNPIALSLNVYLVSSGNANVTEFTVVQNADVTEDQSSLQTKNNQSYWEHTINYLIPIWIPSGAYNVVFEDASSHTNTTVPITVNKAASSTAAPPASSTVPAMSSASVSGSANTSASVTPGKSAASNQVVFTWLPTAACLVLAASLVF